MVWRGCFSRRHGGHGGGGLGCRGAFARRAWGGDEIIHVAKVVFYAECFFYPVIEGIKVDIGQELTGQVADGKASLFRFRPCRLFGGRDSEGGGLLFFCGLFLLGRRDLWSQNTFLYPFLDSICSADRILVPFSRRHGVPFPQTDDTFHGMPSLSSSYDLFQPPTIFPHSLLSDTM